MTTAADRPGAVRATRRGGPVRRAAGFGLGALAARLAFGALRSRPPGGDELWSRTNFRDERLTLLEGPAVAIGASAGAALSPRVPARLRAAALVAGLGAGGFGGYDDLAGSGKSRGFKGHLGALARGEVTTGAVKILGIGATGLAAAALVNRRPIDIAINGPLIAGCANLMNLFDLRPGRAAKVALLAGAPAALAPGEGGAVAAPALGATAALLPDDLGERSMMGDAGANALGALLGVAAAASLPRTGRLALLGGVVGLTAASEVVSFTKVIARTPPLRWLDELGRRPAPAPQAAAAAEPVPSPPAPAGADGDGAKPVDASSR
ncbi:hypothetical protein [Allonocardiopsis opalescens]|uniref:UDP-N-acetylmuramyl pentapeptide phosphotransferase/UDP-N-acetylglucosamine-1-phosphate transferase n=1 Tax=Allonocardiopsis opalescens TaxID=1144618 RepID=A0A2T0PPU8_9ACTN|nr:hypothetical protein [Allonocardiopsis opalescens]PRX90930.1 hypothetical protein CLV72_11526 [Allonocardiopsis opalescens]